MSVTTKMKGSSNCDHKYSILATIVQNLVKSKLEKTFHIDLVNGSDQEKDDLNAALSI